VQSPEGRQVLDSLGKSAKAAAIRYGAPAVVKVVKGVFNWIVSLTESGATEQEAKAAAGQPAATGQRAAAEQSAATGQRAAAEQSAAAPTDKQQQPQYQVCWPVCLPS
jgi:hypothetical protein